MKLPKTISKMLESKYVLYVVLFLAVIQLIGFMNSNNLNAFIYFILIGGFMSFFSKNMIIILAVPLILMSVFHIGTQVSEGYENNKNTKKTVDEGEASDFKPSKDDKKKDTTHTINSSSAAITPLDSDVEGTESATVTGAEEGTNTEQMSLYKKKNNRIDYASTLEDAYGDLNNILGKDGIKNLTSDTQKLMDQQMELAQALKGMTPLITDAKKMLKGMDISGLTDMANRMGV